VRLRARERLADLVEQRQRRPSHPQPVPEHAPATIKHAE
jgi:hypothetical protein